MCLSATSGVGVYVVPCLSEGDRQQVLADQQWSMTGKGQLRTRNGVCIGLDGLAAVAQVECGSAREAVWSFGGKRLLKMPLLAASKAGRLYKNANLCAGSGQTGQC